MDKEVLKGNAADFEPSVTGLTAPALIEIPVQRDGLRAPNNTGGWRCSR